MYVGLGQPASAPPCSSLSAPVDFNGPFLCSGDQSEVVRTPAAGAAGSILVNGVPFTSTDVQGLLNAAYGPSVSVTGQISAWLQKGNNALWLGGGVLAAAFVFSMMGKR